MLTATPESFFQRVQALRPAFFRAVFTRVTAAMLARRAARPVPFAAGLPLAPADFPEVYCLDASRLDTVAHRAKVLRRLTKAVLPGSVEAVYDLRRGCLRAVYFDPDGARAELALLAWVPPEVPRGALLLFDRAYAGPTAIAAVPAAGADLVARARRGIRRRRLAWLRRIREPDLLVDEELIALGHAAPGPVVMRAVRIRTL